MARLVYTIDPDGGRSRRGAGCRACASDPCRCEPEASLPAAMQKLRVRRETSGRHRRVVTRVGPLILIRADANALLSDLKRVCGCGGRLGMCAASGGAPAFELELQGDQTVRVLERLASAGYRVAAPGR